MAGEYIVSARKYRPDSFRSIVGQQAMASTLRISVLTEKIAHAYLFCGPRGVGKTTAARVLAKTINCTNLSSEGEACNECESCRAFNEQRSFNIFELDAASNNSVEDIRSLTEQVGISPVIGRYKVYIIDEVHMLSSAAFNAFLKTLEEPPSYAIFILATTEKHKILPTILSRCQIYDFKRITVMNIVHHLRYVAESEGIEADDVALGLIAEKADGGMRDALSMFDRVASFAGGHLNYEATLECLNILDHSHYMRLVEAMLLGDYRQLLLDFDAILARGFDGQVVVNGLSSFLRDLLVVQHPDTIALLEKPEVVREAYLSLSQRCPVPALYQAIKYLVQCDQQYRTASNKRLLVELTLLSLVTLFSPVLGQPSVEGKPAQRISVAQQTSSASPASTAQVQAVTPATTPSVTATGGAGVTPTANPVGGSSGTPQPATQSAPQPSATIQGRTIVERSTNLVRSGRSSTGAGRLSGLLERSQSGDPSGSQPDTMASSSSIDERQPFTENELQIVWMRYTDEVLPKSEVILRQVMQSNLPVLTETGIVELGVPSTTSKEQVEGIRSPLEQYLRQELHNSTISLHIRILEIQEQRFIPTSPQERFQALAEVNPVIEELRTKLKLRVS